MAYIGRPPEYGGYEKQDITPNGSTTSFALDYSVGTESSLFVSVAGVPQQPGAAYTLSGGGSNIVFSVAPASGATVFVIFLGYAYDTGLLLGTGTMTGQTAVTTLASADLFLVYDDSAAALRKVAFSNVHTGVADMAGNTVKVRDNAASGSPSDKVLATTEILIGDGTGFTAAALSGDVTMANTGAVTIAANAVDSAEITAGSIDTAHIANLQVTLAKMAVNSIDSDQYVDASIDTAHLGDNQVTLAKMAGLARGKIIYGDSSGDPAALAVGAAGTFLKHDGTDVSWGTSGTAWQAVVTGATTMVAGRGYFVNTTGSALSMTLPASATIGDEVHVIDYAGTFDTNMCTVSRNSHKIQGATSDLVVATERAAFKLVYVDATQGWLLTDL